MFKHPLCTCFSEVPYPNDDTLYRVFFRRILQKRTERRSERYHFKLHFKHEMILIDTYAALVSISRPGRDPEYHILQLCRNTRKVKIPEKWQPKTAAPPRSCPPPYHAALSDGEVRAAAGVFDTPASAIAVVVSRRPMRPHPMRPRPPNPHHDVVRG